jgi:xylulokinase
VKLQPSPLQVCRAFEMGQEQLTGLAAREPPGCEGVNFLPYLNGERCPNWPRARASILGLSPG